MMEQEDFAEEKQGIEINFVPRRSGGRRDAPLIGRNSWYNDMCRRIPDTNTGKFKDIFRNPYEDGRPMTYFLYPDLTWKHLEDFLHRQNATIECIERAQVNLENYHYQRMKFIERSLLEGRIQPEDEVFQSNDEENSQSEDAGDSQSENEGANQSGHEHSSESEDGQESSESEHERSKTLSSEDSESEGEVEYNVLENEEEFESKRYRIHSHEEENIRTAVYQTSISEEPENELIINEDDEENLNSIQHAEIQQEGTNGTECTPLERIPSEENNVNNVRLESFGSTNISTSGTLQEVASPLRREEKEETVDIIQDDVPKRVNPVSVTDNKTKSNTGDQGSIQSEAQIHFSQKGPNLSEGDQSKDLSDGQSKDLSNDQSKHLVDDQSEEDTTSQSEGSYGSCQSDKQEQEEEDEREDFIGSYKSDDTYTSCHSDEIYTSSTEENMRQTHV